MLEEPSAARTIPLTPRKSLLLGVLAWRGAVGVPREELAELFWPDGDRQQGRNALKQLIFKTRKRVRRDEIIQAGSVVRLNEAVVATDLGVVTEAIKQRAHEVLAEKLAAPFMHGVREWSSPALDQWLEARRATFTLQYLETLESLARSAETQGDHRRAVHWWRRLVSERPLDQWTASQLSTALTRSGDAAGAYLAAAEYEERVRRDAGTNAFPTEE
jgi:DNA-binding SARP family transcriptional activator